jgi:hypothetical protein
MLSKHLREKIEWTILYVGNECDDWVRIKTEILNNLVNEERKKFSRRHQNSWKQIVNDFDREVMDYWYKRTGVRLVIPKEKLHDESIIYKPRNWGLMLFNQRRAERLKKKNEEDQQEKN